MSKEEVIDLTLSADEEERVAQGNNRQKRQRTSPADDSDIIEVAVEQDGTNANAGNQVELNEDGLVVVHTTLETGNTDYPHTRDNCGVFPYTLGRSTSNKQRCGQCFCYVCDVPAAECTSWGTGDGREDHCNAAPRLFWTREARDAARRRKNATASRLNTTEATDLGPSAGPSTARKDIVTSEGIFINRRTHETFSEPSSDNEDDEDEDEPMVGYGVSMPRPSIYELAELPIPDDEPDWWETAEGRVALQGNKKRIEKLRKKGKVEKCTYIARPDPATLPNMVEIAAPVFQIESRPEHTITELAARFAPCGFYHEPSVGNYGPNKNNKKPSYGDRLTLQSMFDVNFESGCMLEPVMDVLPLSTPPPPDFGSPTRVRPVMIHFMDGRSRPTLHGVEVPASCTLEVLKEATALTLDLARDEELVPFSRRYRSFALFTTISDMGLVLDDSSVYFQKERDADGAVVMCFALCKKASNPPKGSKLPRYAMVRHPPEDRWFSRQDSMLPPIIVPLESSYFRSATAGKDIIHKVAQALMPYKKADAESKVTLEEVKSVVSDLQYDIPRYTYSYDYSEGVVDADVKGALSINKDKRALSNGLLALRVETDSLAGKTLDLSSCWEFQVDPSADSDAAKACIEHIRKLQEHKRLQADAKAIPLSAIREVYECSKEPAPGAPPPDPQLSRYVDCVPRPKVRYRADILPRSSDQRESRGTLVLHIYAFSVAIGGGTEIITAHDDWTVQSKKRRQGSMADTSTFPLNKVMRVLLWNDPKLQSMLHAVDQAKLRSSRLNHARPGSLLEVLETGERPGVRQPSGLTVTMRPYQLQSLAFLLEAERGEGGFRRLLWLPYTTPTGQRLWYSPILRKASWHVPSQPWGGFLCEEMGLGKTVITLALVLANPAPRMLTEEQVQATNPVTGLERTLIRSRATLVVCAVSLVGQWAEEARTKTRGSLRIYEYHGQNRIKNARLLATEYDLVVTTYATLQSDFSLKPKKHAVPSPLHGVYWHRIVLDESHTVKNPASGHTKACMALEADRRWCCTGTPISTEINDLFGQFLALRMAPFNNKVFFDARVKHVMQENRYYGSSSNGEVVYMLDHSLVRHTKRQVLGGEEVLQLPPKTEELVPVTLTAEEQAAYKAAHERSAGFFKRFLEAGPHAITRNLLQIMSLLVPMRRICSGGPLKPSELEAAEPCWDSVHAHALSHAHTHMGAVSAQSAMAAAAAMQKDPSLVAPTDDECSICMDAFQDPVMTSCNHWFCKECILSALSQVNARCPLCRGSQLPAQLRAGVTAAEAAEATGELPSQEAEAAAVEAAYTVPEGGVLCESKLHALLLKLREMRRADPSAKALVFSQYNSTIEWLKAALTREGFGHRHISGSMPMKQRAKAVAAFQNDPPTTVFLLSMRSGAVGINLTAASHVFLLEPALNPALEEQAIGRAWRMGQQREVKVLRFYVKGSVEEKIMDVVRHRQGIAGPSEEANNAAGQAENAGAAAGGSGSGGGGGGGGAAFATDLDRFVSRHLEDDPMLLGYGGGRNRSNVRVEDMAGSIKADKQNLRISELQTLFANPSLGAPRVPQPLPPLDDDEQELVRRQFSSHAAPPKTTRVRRANAGTADVAMDDVAGNDDDADDLPWSLVSAPIAPSNVASKTRMRRSKAGIAAVAGLGGGSTTAAAPATAAGEATPTALLIGVEPPLLSSGDAQHPLDADPVDDPVQMQQPEQAAEGEQGEGDGVEQQQQQQQQADAPSGRGSQGRLQLIERLRKASADIRGRLTPAMRPSSEPSAPQQPAAGQAGGQSGDALERKQSRFAGGEILQQDEEDDCPHVSPPAGGSPRGGAPSRSAVRKRRPSRRAAKRDYAAMEAGRLDSP